MYFLLGNFDLAVEGHGCSHISLSQPVNQSCTSNLNLELSSLVFLEGYGVLVRRPRCVSPIKRDEPKKSHIVTKHRVGWYLRVDSSLSGSAKGRGLVLLNFLRRARDFNRSKFLNYK